MITIASPVFAATHLVRPDGTGDYATIQEAVTAAAEGDTVSLGDGTFTGEGNRDIDFLGKDLTVRSESDDPELCIIDCEGSESDPHRGFHFHTAEGPESILRSVTITHGYISSATGGGGIYCESASHSIVNCAVVENETGGVMTRGGGILCIGTSTPTISDCTIADNTAGGVQGYGGGINCREDSSPTIDNCTITGNSATYTGGGVYLYYSFPLITNCTISENTAIQGGGLTCGAYSPTLEHCIIVSNVADVGGAIYLELSSPEITYCTFWGNSASIEGAAIHCDLSSPTLIRVVIAMSIGGETISCGASSEPNLLCCNLFENGGGDWTGCIAEHEGIHGNLSMDPRFCDPPAGNFGVGPDSPCLPENNSCSVLIGALGESCTAGEEMSVEPATWSRLKQTYRRERPLLPTPDSKTPQP